MWISRELIKRCIRLKARYRTPLARDIIVLIFCDDQKIRSIDVTMI